MIYQVKVPKVEAEAVVLSTGRVFVVNVNGTPHVMAAASFEQLYAPVDDRAQKDGAIAAAVKALPAAPSRGVTKKAAPATKRTANTVPSAAGELSTGAAIMKALSEGPQTQAELTGRACQILGWDYQDKALRERVYENIWLRIKNGQIVKRDDPNTQLTKLHPGGAA